MFEDVEKKEAYFRLQPVIHAWVSGEPIAQPADRVALFDYIRAHHAEIADAAHAALLLVGSPPLQIAGDPTALKLLDDVERFEGSAARAAAEFRAEERDREMLASPVLDEVEASDLATDAADHPFASPAAEEDWAAWEAQMAEPASHHLEDVIHDAALVEREGRRDV